MSDHEHFYLICENKCLVEGVPKSKYDERQEELDDELDAVSEKFAEIDEKFTHTVSTDNILSLIYPVGSIYMSVNNVSPHTFLGGTWTALGGKFLLGADSTYPAGSTGGEATHTLTKAEMPSHTHGKGTYRIQAVWGNVSYATPPYPNLQGAIKKDSDTGARFDSGSNGGTGVLHLDTNENAGGLSGWIGSSGSAGSGDAHNNMPPYLSVYMWKRTA